MAHAHTDQWQVRPTAAVNEGTNDVELRFGSTRLVMDCEVAVTLRDDLSRAITEAATAAAKQVAA